MSVAADQPSLVDLAAALHASIVPLSRNLRRTSTDHLTPTQLSVLGTIHRAEGISMGEISGKEGLAPATVTRVVSSLVDAGMVERLPDENDRRVCRVQLTSTGRAWAESSREQRHAWLAARLSRLDPAQLQVLAEATSLLSLLTADDDE